MNDGTSKRMRWNIPEPRGSWKTVLEGARRQFVWSRVLLAAVWGVVLWIVFAAWSPAFPYRVRLAPLRPLQARVPFEYIDVDATAEAQRLARNSAICFYRNAPEPFRDLRQAIRDRIFEIKSRQYAELQPEVWSEFYSDIDGETPPDAAEQATAESYERFRTALARDETLEAVARALETAFADFERTGLLQTLEHEFGQGSMQELYIVRAGEPEPRRVDVADVRIAEIREALRRRLHDEFARETAAIDDPPLVAERIFQWLNHKLPTTLTWDHSLSRQEAERSVAAVPQQFMQFRPGDRLEIKRRAGLETPSRSPLDPLTANDLALLRAEHIAFNQQQLLGARFFRSFSFFGMIAAVCGLLAGFLFYRDRQILDDLRSCGTLLGLMLIALVAAWILAMNPESRSELIPVVMFAILAAIAFNVELAIVASGLMAVIFALAHGYGLASFVVLAGGASTAALLCRTIRSRTRLIYVGFAVAAVVGPTTLGGHYMLGQPLTPGLLLDGLWYGGSAILASLFMTALLPFLESWFEIQTDINLLELGDANHPLLRELVQRAPGTYNHSISVASIAESAAKAVGVNPLLCRVGAYFHDIGKMRKPEYFVENQTDVNKHEDLVPTMSTLVIIAHVKDGVEMARQHRLPKRVIDIIEQHHGTTLVEFFYNRASQRAPADETPEEASFRYPGPKPQSPEAAILMLADAAESSSRTLRDPGPARLESLVESIVMKRLADGQLDDCALTLRELHDIQNSIVKSLNAIYHARIRYPETVSGA